MVYFTTTITILYCKGYVFEVKKYAHFEEILQIYHLQDVLVLDFIFNVRVIRRPCANKKIRQLATMPAPSSKHIGDVARSRHWLQISMKLADFRLRNIKSIKTKRFFTHGNISMVLCSRQYFKPIYSALQIKVHNYIYKKVSLLVFCHAICYYSFFVNIART